MPLLLRRLSRPATGSLLIPKVNLKAARRSQKPCHRLGSRWKSHAPARQHEVRRLPGAQRQLLAQRQRWLMMTPTSAAAAAQAKPDRRSRSHRPRHQVPGVAAGNAAAPGRRGRHPVRGGHPTAHGGQVPARIVLPLQGRGGRGLTTVGMNGPGMNGPAAGATGPAAGAAATGASLLDQRKSFGAIFARSLSKVTSQPCKPTKRLQASAWRLRQAQEAARPASHACFVASLLLQATVGLESSTPGTAQAQSESVGSAGSATLKSQSALQVELQGWLPVYGANYSQDTAGYLSSMLRRQACAVVERSRLATFTQRRQL